MRAWLIVLLILASVLPAVPLRAQSADASCGLDQPAFCDTFDMPAGTGNRAGDLDGTIWGVSRLTGLTGFGAQQHNPWPATRLDACTGSAQVRAPRDVTICDGQLREASNDNGGVSVLAMYPKQPFDFADRTGKVTFDVGNDSEGSHAAWPEFWITDKPVPAPFGHFFTWRGYPQFGFGLRFDGFVDANGHQNACPEGDKAGYTGVGSAIVIDNWVPNDYDNAGNTLSIRGFDCVKPPTRLGELNHYEIDVSTTQIDVYGTDAGTTAPLKHLATLSNLNLGFTRGLIWLQDVHYNANKAVLENPSLVSQREHTFVWDNVGFDGPFTYRDLSFDALDNTEQNADGTINLGRAAGPGLSAAWDVLGLPANPSAASVRVLFNFFHYDAPSNLRVGVNGHAHSVAWPYPERQGYTWRTLAVSIPITDLVTGTNRVTIGGDDQGLISSNVNIVLVDAAIGAAIPVPATAVPASTPMPAATPTPTPPLCEVEVWINGSSQGKQPC